MACTDAPTVSRSLSRCPAPSDEARPRCRAAQDLFARSMKLLTWRGVLAQEEGSIHLAHCDCDGDSDDARTIRPLEATACAYRIAFGPHATAIRLPKRSRERPLLVKRFSGSTVSNQSIAAIRCEADFLPSYGKCIARNSCASRYSPWCGLTPSVCA